MTTETTDASAPAAEQEQPKPKGSIVDKTVLLVLMKGKIGNSRKIKSSAIHVNAESRMVAASKRLLESPELKAITSLDGEAMAWLATSSLPSMFKTGMYLLPIALVQQTEEKLKEFAARRVELVKLFLDAYPGRVAEVAAPLGELYNPLDYPSVEIVAQAFRFEWQYVDFGVPGRLKAISATMFEQEMQKAQQRVALVEDGCKVALRERMQELIAHAIDRLTGVEGEDSKRAGKPKIFKSSTLDNINAFLGTFAQMNVADDAELNALVQQARNVMNGIDADTLRDDELSRKTVSDQFAQIKLLLDPMIIDKPARGIAFDDV